jgi:exopolyphosphatase/guanosine-5'-triphosphate,3'-diphosphate pyrophosphatase
VSRTPEPHSKTNGRRLAAIDIGSNSIRLLVAEAMADGAYRVLDDEKQTTRLAHGLNASGQLSEAAMSQSVQALERMKTIAQGYGIQRLEVIATSAVREASNRQRFLDLIQERLKLPVEVISPGEEGQLSFLSAARHFNLKPIDAVIVDLGGGSVELVFAAKGVIEEIYSFPLGSVRLTEAFVKSDPLSDRDHRHLKKHIRKHLSKIVERPGFHPHLMIGAGGTFMALAHMSMRRREAAYGSIAGYELNRSEVVHIFENLRDLPLKARRNVPGLHADRADIILAGLVVIERLMKLLHVNRLQIHDRGVRDGLLLRMIGQYFHSTSSLEEKIDPLAGVRQFGQACAFEPKHAEHVAFLARQLFDQLRGALYLPAEEGLLLEAAALLHEVGYLINYEKHHQHSYHLIMHGNLRGLTPKQRELVANIARYHRKAGPKLKHTNFARLLPSERQTVRRLSAFLRVADGLDRTHTQQIKSIRCRRRKNQIWVIVCAAQRPEVDLWGAQQKGKLFRKVFGADLRFSWKPVANGKLMTTKKGKSRVDRN